MPKTPEEIAAEVAAAPDVKVEDAAATTVVPKVEQDAPAIDPAEVAARAKGWKPKDEYKGDRPWVDAATFLDREPLIERISGQSKTIARLERTVNTMARHFTKSVEHAVNAKIAELQFQKDEAIKSGNVAEVRAIDKAIDEQNSMKAAAPAGGNVIPEVEAWVEKNPWYNTDRELHDFALAYNDAYLKRNPGDLEGSLKATSDATKRAFPEKFTKSAPKPPGSGNGTDPPAAPVEGNHPPASPTKKYTVGRLNSDQRMAHDQYIKAGTFDELAKAAKMTPTEYYVKQLDEIGELTR